MQLKQGFLMKTVTMDISFKLQHLKQVSKLSEALFPSHIQAGYCVNCIPDGSCVLCVEVFKAMWSEGLSDKCAAVIYVWNKELHINVCEIKPHNETDISLEHPAAYIVLKFQG